MHKCIMVKIGEAKKPNKAKRPKFCMNRTKFKKIAEIEMEMCTFCGHREREYGVRIIGLGGWTPLHGNEDVRRRKRLTLFVPGH